MTLQKSRHDVWVGLFVMTGAAALLFLAMKAGNLLSLNFDATYGVVARFDNIGGLKPRAAVKSAGVVVGRVESISFDDKTFQASVALQLQEKFKFPKDSSAKILTFSPAGRSPFGRPGRPCAPTMRASATWMQISAACSTNWKSLGWTRTPSSSYGGTMAGI
jgi:phospholipid/cholesterol/gamma-HCH transport system substrate-binding protein